MLLFTVLTAAVTQGGAHTQHQHPDPESKIFSAQSSQEAQSFFRQWVSENGVSRFDAIASKLNSVRFVNRLYRNELEQALSGIAAERIYKDWQKFSRDYLNFDNSPRCSMVHVKYSAELQALCSAEQKDFAAIIGCIEAWRVFNWDNNIESCARISTNLGRFYPCAENMNPLLEEARVKLEITSKPVPPFQLFR